MTREVALSILRTNEGKIKEKGILTLRLFGSVARNEATASSDIDLLANFDPALSLSLLDIVRIERELQEMIGTRVDLMEERSMRNRIRNHALREAVLAF